MERTGDEVAVASDLLIDALRSIDQDRATGTGRRTVIRFTGAGEKHGTNVDRWPPFGTGLRQARTADDADRDLSRLETEAERRKFATILLRWNFIMRGFPPRRHSGRR